MARMKLTFDGFKELAEAIDKAGLDLDKAAEKALKETGKLIQSNVSSAGAPYAGTGLKGYATGKMFNAIKDDARVEKKGTVYEVSVGFNLSAAGGFHSIFMMWGTPRIAKDNRLWASVFGAETKADIAKLQEQVLTEYLRLGGK